MKTVKSLLLGSAAGFVALTGAQAADLPLAEPVEYVKVCSTYGEGFFYIPGTDTCLQISGRVRVEGYIDFNGEDDDDDDFLGEAEEDNFSTRARGVIAADARTETEWGTLRSYIEYEANNDSGLYDDGDVGIEMVAGFIQFAGITAGFAGSFFDFAEQNTWADFFSSEDVWTLAYTASFGSGFAATIAIEDKYYRARPGTGLADDPILGLVPDDTLDQTWPNVVAALRVDQAWGSAQISAAVQDNSGDREDYFAPIAVDDEVGFAVQAAAKFNLPFANEGSYAVLQGVYSEGATSYAGAEEDIAFGTALGDFIVDQSVNADGELVNNTLWGVGGGFGFQATQTVQFNVFGGFYQFSPEGDIDIGDGLFLEDDLDLILVEGNVVWTPVDNLDLGLYVLYGHSETTAFDAVLGEDVDIEEDDLRIITRIQRDF